MYARVTGGKVAEVFTPPSGYAIGDCFHPDIASQFVDTGGADPQPGWTATQSGGAWEFAPDSGPTLAQMQESQAAALRSECAAAIVSGFMSSALGFPATYPSDTASQNNILMAAVAGGALWCENASQWSFVLHTAAEAQQVRSDLAAHIQAMQLKYSGLLAQVNAAGTIAAVQSVVWA